MSQRRPVLLITGGSSGVGAATARAAVATHDLVLVGRRPEPLGERVEELGEERAIGIPCDVTEWDDQQAMVAAGLERFGRIDTVFVNAGILTKRGMLGDSVERWREMILTNLLGAALTIRASLPHLLERGEGHYVIMGSVAGRVVIPGSLYSATKAGLAALGRNLAAELGESCDNGGIRVTVIEPGMIRTPLFGELPGSRALDVEDVARAVMFVLTQPPGVEVSELLVRPVGLPDDAPPSASKP